MTTYPLTAGTDNLTGGAGPDVFTGTTADWQAADTLAGGTGNDTLQITVQTAAAANVADAMFQHITSMETLALSGKFAETVTLGALSDAAGLVELDGRGLTGNLTLDASQRMYGITVDAAAGANTLTGTVTDDTFRFTSAGLSSTDKVDGGGVGDSDTIEITDKAALVDAAFTHVTHVERLVLDATAGVDYTGQKVTLGAFSVAAGINELDVLNTHGATIDASARSFGIDVEGGAGNDIMIASKGQDTFHGGGGSDSFQAKEALFNQGDTIDGGADRDEIRLLDAGTAIVDFDFAAVRQVESLVFAATGKQTVTLDSFAAKSGLDTIDASKETGGLDLTLKTGMTSDLTIDLGTGADQLQLAGGGRHVVVMKSTALTLADSLVGDASGNDFLSFSDAVKLTDKSFANFKNVDNFGFLSLDSAAKGQTLVAGDAFKAFVIADGLHEIIANGAAKDTSVTFDFSKYTGPALAINGSGGGDIYYAGQAENTYFATASDSDQGVGDSFRYQSAYIDAGDIVYGGKSAADEVVILDDGTAIVDADFTQMQNVEILRLQAAKSGTYAVTLDTHAMAAGFTTVDASAAGVNAKIDAHTLTTALTVLAGAKDNTIATGSGDDTVVIDTKTLNGSDHIDGGGGTSGDTLKFTNGGVITAAMLAGVSGVEVLQLSDKGNTLTLTDDLPGSATGVIRHYDGFQFIDETYVQTGLGKDTVDLSQLNTYASHVAIIGSAGDKYIGSSGSDTFVFQKSSDLTAANQIDGGAGSDSLLLAGGTYTAAQLHGMKHVDGILFSDVDPNASFSIALDNTFFKNSDADAVTVFTLAKGDLTLDASAVTDPLAALKFLGASTNVVLKGTAGNDSFIFQTDNTGHVQLDSNDTVAGNGGLDTIVLNASYNGTVAVGASNVAHVTGVEMLYLQGGSNTLYDVVADQSFQAAGITQINALGSVGKASIDATGYTGDVLVVAGQSTDTIKTGSGNDTIELQHIPGALAGTLTSGDVVDGGTGAHDRLLFDGDATLASADFAHVYHVEEVDLQDGGFTFTLGTETDSSGIAKVDAHLAGAAVTINAAPSHNDLWLIGSAAGDTLSAGDGTVALQGGLGGDTLNGGTGTTVFTYRSAADSRLEAGNNQQLLDKISGFHTGDLINIDNIVGGISSVSNHGTVGAFQTTDVAGFFGGSLVAAEFDGTNTRVYVDANHDGNFNLNQDLVIQLVGNHMTDVTDVNTYA
jgi:Ca2+-binding RTX toxin-like protein